MITDEMLRRAAAASCERYTDALTEACEPIAHHEYSPDFQRKLKKLTRRAKLAPVYTLLRRVAAFLLALLLAGSTWLLLDVEARAAFVSWLREVYETSVFYHYGGGEIHAVPARYRMDYVPDGYQVYFENRSEEEGTMIYRNAEDQLLQFFYISDPNEARFVISGESLQSRTVRVHQYDAVYYTEKDGSAAVIWTDEAACSLYVSGFFTEEELLKIAENVVKE